MLIRRQFFLWLSFGVLLLIVSVFFLANRAATPQPSSAAVAGIPEPSIPSEQAVVSLQHPADSARHPSADRPGVQFRASTTDYATLADLPILDLYDAHIDSAGDGDPRSQFLVGKMLQYCAGTAKTSGDVTEAELLGTLPDDVIRLVRLKFDKCKALNVQIDDLRGESEFWLFLSSEAGFSPAQATQATRTFADQSPEVVRSTIRQALTSAGGDQVIEAEALRAAMSYFANIETSRFIEREAWTLLYCEKSVDCDLNEHWNEYVEVSYRQHEIDEIVTLANTYKSAIETGQWQDLGF